MNLSRIENKVKGSLYGFAIGDAMGATTEFQHRSEIRQRYGKVTNIVGGGAFKLVAGKGTDDTAMTLCVCDAIEHAQKAKAITDESKLSMMLDACCKNFIRWLKYDGLGCGRCCFEAIVQNKFVVSHEDWIRNNFEPVGTPDEKRRLGNGSLMRTMPIVLSGLGCQAAMLQSRLTHHNKECDFAITTYYDILAGILKDDNFYFDEPAVLVEPTGHVVNTLSNSRYWVQNTYNFERAMVGAVNDGGDADTIAAITGSIAGALHGYNSIPVRWIEQLDINTKKELDRYSKLFSKMYVHNYK